MYKVQIYMKDFSKHNLYILVPFCKLDYVNIAYAF